MAHTLKEVKTGVWELVFVSAEELQKQKEELQKKEEDKNKDNKDTKDGTTKKEEEEKTTVKQAIKQDLEGSIKKSECNLH